MVARTPLLVLERHARAYRRTWRSNIVSTFVNPILFLAAMGLGLGVLVDSGSNAGSLGATSYLEFLAPGLLAASAMQTGAGDGMFAVMAGMRWIKNYDAALATPVASHDLVYGHMAWLTVRQAFTSAIFVFVMVLFGAVSVGSGLIAILPAMLTGVAVGAVVTAYAAQLKTEYGMSTLFRFGIVPMFLFSGTFFPITQLPGWMQPLAYFTPLWHGVELTRSLVLDRATTWPWLVHTGYLVVWIVVGVALSVVLFRRRLEK